MLVLQAVALEAHGERGEALNVLNEALALARPGGFVRRFVDEGPPMARLLEAAQAQEIAPRYTRELLAAFPPAGPEPAAPSASPLVEPLSERELEVLQRIAQGLTNREVAERLYISLYTVKAHARNIYGKLGVGNRTQAVARARELGIL